MTFIEFFSAFGLGAIVVALVQAWFSRRAYLSKRNFDEKKEVYVGLLDALHQSEINSNNESAHLVGHRVNRTELVGSKDVVDICTRLFTTNPVDGKVHPERPETLRKLKDAMRIDLGVNRSL